MRRVLKRTPEEMARREKIDEMLKAANVTSMADIPGSVQGDNRPVHGEWTSERTG